MSSDISPATSAGPSGSQPVIMAPNALSISAARACRRGTATVCAATPMKARRTRPCWMISLSTNCAVLLATAKQMPCAPAITAVLMPITSPREDTSGPPELPGLSAASVWITSSISRPVRARSDRPSAEITPAVTVDSKPSGLPIATASWPRRSFLESPSVADGEVARGAGAEQRQVGVGVLADQPRLHAAALGVGQAQFARAFDHVAVGQHEAVRRDHDARARCRRGRSRRRARRAPPPGRPGRRPRSRHRNRRRAARRRAPPRARRRPLRFRCFES